DAGLLGRNGEEPHRARPDTPSRTARPGRRTDHGGRRAVNMLHEKFEELAGAAGPPSRMSADDVYTAAWRRRRWHTSAWVAGGLATGLLATALGVTTLRHPSDAGPAQPPPS